VVAASLGAVGVAGLLWGLAEARAFVLRRVTVPQAGSLEGALHVLHVSDIHLVPRQHGKLAWLRSLDSLDPDLVVVTGDFLADADSVPPLLEALEGLLHRPGVFVLGSNDYYAPKRLNPFKYFGGPSRLEGDRTELPTGSLVAGLTAGGWLDLTNTRGDLVVRGHTISFVGVDDPHLERDQMPAPGPVSATLHVGVAHAPYSRVLGAFHHEHADIIFAGHTHGGQVCVPGLGALVTNCDLDRSRAKGLSGWPGKRPDATDPDGSTWLHVSAGLGTSPFAPVRFACRPEATLLTIEPHAGL
jgi:predicted MPP superfamily phosphohydrolase